MGSSVQGLFCEDSVQKTVIVLEKHSLETD